MPIPDNESCATCVFAVKMSKSLYCYRFPPKAMPDGTVYGLPPVPPLHWCGEWRHHELEEDDE